MITGNPPGRCYNKIEANIPLRNRQSYKLGGGTLPKGSFVLGQLGDCEWEGIATSRVGYNNSTTVKFLGYGLSTDMRKQHGSNDDAIMGNVSLTSIVKHLKRRDLDLIARCHSLFISTHTRLPQRQAMLLAHECTKSCGNLVL